MSEGQMKTVEYGLWHPDEGWYCTDGTVWTTNIRLIALALCDSVERRWAHYNNAGWKVRSLLEWTISEKPDLEWSSEE